MKKDRSHRPTPGHINPADDFSAKVAGDSAGPMVDTPPRMEVDRRTFLKAAGFTFAGTMLAGCSRGSVDKAIPYLVKPEEVTPGTATWYASTCGGCPAGCGVLVKNRDGRPIKIEGNPEHPLSKGGLCAVGQAMVLSLYDSRRLRGPMRGGATVTWDDVDRTVMTAFESAVRSGKAIRIVSGGGQGPTLGGALGKFTSRYPGSRHIVHEPLSGAAIADAHSWCYGRRFIPHYRFDRAEVIVSFDADFLGTWLSPVEFTADYRAGRSLEGSPPKMSRHVQFESRMSLTGSNADKRVVTEPDEMSSLIRTFAALVESETGAAGSGIQAGVEGGHARVLRPLVRRLVQAGIKGLVVCGVNDLASQLLTAYVNHLLGNGGFTVVTGEGNATRAGNDAEFMELLEDMEAGRVGTLILHGVNPVYDSPAGKRFATAMSKTELTVVFAEHDDETAEHADIILPKAHPLEEWDDTEAVPGIVSVRQPAIAPFGDPRSLTECLHAWMGEKVNGPDAIRREWQSGVFPRQNAETDFGKFWNQAVHDGFASVRSAAAPPARFDVSAVRNLAGAADPGENPGGRDTSGGEYNLELYPTLTLLDGRHAHNPWLQELPDPVTKVVWDNYASLSPATARKLDLNESDVVSIETDGQTIELPVVLQPGQGDGTIAVALGYGRKGTDRFTNIGPDWIEAVPTVQAGDLVGRNAAPLGEVRAGYHRSYRPGVSARKTGRTHTIASTQIHHSLHVPEHLAPENAERRPIVQETSLAAYMQSPGAGSFRKHEILDLWPDEHKFPNHRWMMAIDLNACTGCSACVVGCQAENNIPVVGKDEVYRNREMTWLRIDRYYTEADEGVSVAHQPMMCQHCAHAPCETVCPVLATVHSEEGLNQQVYNRCVGTRYCSNNCPYKVRRFNWFEYPRGDERSRLVLNPDVVVRERGVMEKCSFCVQRIQEGRINAKGEKRPMADGDVSPACEQSCPARAIVFGDVNDPESRISKINNDPRYYRVLEEVGVEPSVGYLTLVRNTGAAVESGNIGDTGESRDAIETSRERAAIDRREGRVGDV